VFVTTVPPIDITCEISGRYLTFANNLLAAVPIVLYIKWAFQHICWIPADETSACVVLDDPLLRPRYGFVRFDRLLRLMEVCNFSTSVGFIPWNWNRSSATTAQLFRAHPRRFSLCIHGTDHTGRRIRYDTRGSARRQSASGSAENGESFHTKQVSRTIG
jgi:hypothetical protein